MKRRTRIVYSAQQKEVMWEPWKKGDTIHEIARLFDRGHSSIERILKETGGFRPKKRKRSLAVPMGHIWMAVPIAEAIAEAIAEGIAEGMPKGHPLLHCKERHKMRI